MGAPTNPAGAAGTLPAQVQGAYTGALGQFGNMAQTGNQFLGGAAGAGQDAAGLFSQMGGMTPSDVTAGQLSTTDLSPYMNPYTDQVINRSMGELDRQQGIQQQGIDDASQRQNAFGGDRMYLQKGVLGGEFGRVKGNLLADLYSKNFQNAQNMGQFDITSRLGADQGNQNMRSGLSQAGASGLAGLFGTGGSLGANLSSSGAGGMGDLAGSGFQMANQANASRTAATQAAQQQQQASIDAANASLSRMLGIPQDYLEAMLGITSGMGSFGFTKNKGTSTTNPGALSIAGAGLGALGTIAGMPVG